MNVKGYRKADARLFISIEFMYVDVIGIYTPFIKWMKYTVNKSALYALMTMRAW